MRIQIKTRHTHISDDIKQYAVDKLQAVAERSMPVIDTTITVDKEKLDYIVDVTLAGKHVDYHATTRDENLHTAIDEMVSKIGRHLQKSKGKVKAHEATHLGFIEARTESEEELEDEVLQPEIVEIIHLPTEKAISKVLGSKLSFLLYVEPTNKMLTLLEKSNSEHFSITPISEELTKSPKGEIKRITFKAAKIDNGNIKIEQTGEDTISVTHLALGEAIKIYHNAPRKPFFFFINKSSSRPNILYYKEDHKVSLIVPAFHLYQQGAHA